VGWGVGIVAIVLAVVIGLAIVFNTYREQKIVLEYTNETLALVSTKKNLFQQLFTTVMQTCQVHDEQERAQSKAQKDYIPSDMCRPAQEMLSAIGVETLKNSSAIAYLAVRDKSVAFLEASGKYHPYASVTDNNYTFSYGGSFGSSDTRLALSEYLTRGKPLSTLWWDYINYIPGKEVIVPIEIDGVRVGYIFRGVIEK
jgi:hypothetical protein